MTSAVALKTFSSFPFSLGAPTCDAVNVSFGATAVTIWVKSNTRSPIVHKVRSTLP